MKTKIACLVVSLVWSLTCTGQQVPDHLRGKFNPEYHFYPSIDPTGLFYYAGKYYLNWGSASSVDLVHWQMTPYGIERRNQMMSIFSGNMPLPSPGNKNPQPPSPFQSQIISGISGSAFIDVNNTSGLGENGKPPLIAYNVSDFSTYFAYSNDTAKTWKRFDRPAILQNSSGTFRDPKVFWYEPEQKWVMVLPWCEIQEVRFFSSKDLKNWEYMSKFGPWGAVDGQWECVEFFPLAVDGNPSNVKWLLTISLQPRNCEYFLGDFDGKRFTLDQSFINELSYDRYVPSGQMLFDFERSLDGWKIEGDAFNDCPTVAEGVNGKGGSRSIKSGRGTGKITSPEFTIDKNYIKFLVGGGYYPEKECVNLLVDGKIVRTQTGNSGNAHVNWAAWDVSEFRNKKARIEIVDNMTQSGMAIKGYIYCDNIMLSDDMPVPPYQEYNFGWEKAFWTDWGADFYAVRAWTNYAPGENRTIWTGWMGNWKYNNEPILGIFSVPRTLELKTNPEGIRLIQKPIKELESLRTTHIVAEPTTFEGILAPKKFNPAKNSYELIVEFENISAEEFGLNLCTGVNEKTVIGYNVYSEQLYVDRRLSGYSEFSPVFPSVNKGPLKNRTNTIKLHIFIDKCSVEVFGNDGETTISSKIYPDLSSTGISIFSNNGKVKIKSLELWNLSSINL